MERSRRSDELRVLFICGSINQTSQMHQIAEALPEHECWFTPYSVGLGHQTWAKDRHYMEHSIAGTKLRRRCLDYLDEHELRVDLDGRAKGHDYALIVTCTDQLYPRELWDRPVVLVQEGILDPVNLLFHIQRVLPRLVARWVPGTAATGQSKRYDAFCVASEGYRDYFIKYGVPEEKLVVTGIPNFDDCDRYRDNEFPRRDYVLVCTSDARETGKIDNRRRFIRQALDIAAGRPVIFKLHPNEDHPRARQEIEQWAPDAEIYARGSAEEMVANCAVLVCQYSTLAYVGIALDKEVHSYFELETLHRLLPVQNHKAATRIARVCRQLIHAPGRAQSFLPVSAEQATP